MRHHHAAAAMLLVAAGAIAALSSCGGKKKSDPQGSSDAGTGAAADAAVVIAAAPAVPLPMGKADLGGYAYSQGPGRESFVRALAARRKSDWTEVEAQCRDALLRDPGHLEAHWLLAQALVAQARFDEALDPLSAAVAGDWQRWGDLSTRVEALAAFRNGPAGERYLELAARYREIFRRGVGDGLILVARRGDTGPPRKRGATLINQRSEVYAYHLASGRYLRLSRSDGSAVGYLRAPDGASIAYAAYEEVFLPPGGKPGAIDGAYMRSMRVGGVGLAGERDLLRDAVLENVAVLDLWYRPDGGLRARATHGEKVALYEIDLTRGSARKLAEPEEPAGEYLHVEYDYARRRRAAIEDVAADWDEERAAGAFRLGPTRKTITVPSGEAASGDTLTWSGNRTRLAFSTRPVDECSAEPGARRATLYVVEAATGRLHAVAVGDGPFDALWLDDQRLAYLDRSGDQSSVRVLDVGSGSELSNLEARGGLGITWLPSVTRCRAAPVVPAPPADEVEEPREESEPGEPGGLPGEVDAGARE